MNIYNKMQLSEIRTININQDFAPVYLKKPLVIRSRKNKLRIRKKDVCGYFTTVKNYIEKYLETTSLHGLKYAGDPSISYGERFFWLAAFIASIIMALYFILQIYDKYDKTPVIITLNPLPVIPYEMPFPAITICNLNKVITDQAEIVNQNGSSADRSFLEDTCDFSDTPLIKTSNRQAEKYDNYYRFMKKVYPSCKQILKVCKWHHSEIDCLKIFQEVLTDEGVCCTFNQLPYDYIYRNNTRKETIVPMKLNRVIDDWNPEDGYAPNSSFKIYPYRCTGAGAHLGLTVVLDTMIDKYYCSSLNSAGFKVILHTPTDIPKSDDFSFLIPAGHDTRVRFKPSFHDASFDIRSIDIEKRNCYFNNERSLKYFRTYSEINCKLECLANRTTKICGCAPFYLPANVGGRTCGKLQERCMDNVKQQMETTDTGRLGDRWCNCLVGCFNIEYDKTQSSSQFTGNFRIPDAIIKNISRKYFTENMAVVEFFFTVRNFKKYTKSRLYGFSELVSNTGGLLGLFLGFSLLSVVEIGYHFTFRLCCMYTRNKRMKSSSKIVNFTK